MRLANNSFSTTTISSITDNSVSVAVFEIPLVIWICSLNNLSILSLIIVAISKLSNLTDNWFLNALTTCDSMIFVILMLFLISSSTSAFTGSSTCWYTISVITLSSMRFSNNLCAWIATLASMSLILLHSFANCLTSNAVASRLIAFNNSAGFYNNWLTSATIASATLSLTIVSIAFMSIKLSVLIIFSF